MEATIPLKWGKLTYRVFKWRYQLAVPKKLALSFGMACITGILAQIRIPLPFTPVPITGQVLGVLLSGVFCGPVFGMIAQLIYVGFGILGLPWFAGAYAGSISTFTSPTGGYFVGFILAPLLIGRFTDGYISSRRFILQLWLMLSGVAVIYICGAIVFALVMETGFFKTLLQAVLPFIPGDILKALIAAGFSSLILPKTSYNGEKDKLHYIK